MRQLEDSTLEGKVDSDERKFRELLYSSNLTDRNYQDLMNRLLGPKNGEHPAPIIHKLPSKHTRFVIIGDLHLNARAEDGGYGCDFAKLKKVLHIAKEGGAEFVIQTGDVTDGEHMRHQQKYGLMVQGFDNVVEFSANVWPDCGLPTFFIGGNHDETYLNWMGADVCKAIADKRPDLHYLGMNEGNVPLQPHYQKLLMKAGNELEHNRLLKQMLKERGPSWIRIRHPSKGSAKGRSYQPQQHVESLEGKFKPNILVIGHYHKMDYLFKRNVHIFQAGTFEKQSGWMRTKDLQAHLGGIFVDAYFNENGTIIPMYHGCLEYEVNGREDFGILGGGKKGGRK